MLLIIFDMTEGLSSKQEGQEVVCVCVCVSVCV